MESWRQAFWGAKDLVSYVVILKEQSRDLQELKTQVAASLPPDWRVKNWMSLLPELLQSIEFDNAGGLLMLMERQREFAILLALGMQRWQMGVVVFLETLILGGVGGLGDC